MPYRKLSHKSSGPKATAWSWFSKYIRLRDALATTGKTFICQCITCEEVFDIEYIDAGHMIGGRSGGILFDETIVFGQCHGCNRDHGGEYQAFKRVMVARNGIAWYEMKVQARKTPTKLGDFECKLISDEYRKKYNELRGRI
jgi:NAD-dependent SIR2 family protein deacetylase